jgi:hypothetical protein
MGKGRETNLNTPNEGRYGIFGRFNAGAKISAYNYHGPRQDFYQLFCTLKTGKDECAD